jgi:hypothetical protein
MLKNGQCSAIVVLAAGEPFSEQQIDLLGLADQAVIAIRT